MFTFDPRPCLRLLAGRARRCTGVGVVVALLGLALGGCAQQPRQVAAGHGSEYFPASVYGPASRRVIADGQPVPRGGGQYLVGRPYTIAGRTYYPSESRRTQVGYASWYGDAFHGRLTANGEIYDRDGFTAASPTMPLPSYARVTNLRNNYSMIVRVNDRGPYASNRIMDVSRRVAEALDYKRYGTARIKVEYVGRASLAGSDDAKLFATLRTDGPARWDGQPTMVADASRPETQVASLAPYVPARRTEIDDRPAAEIEAPPSPRRAVRERWEEGAMPRRRDEPVYDPGLVRHAIAIRQDDRPSRDADAPRRRTDVAGARDGLRRTAAPRFASSDAQTPPRRPRFEVEDLPTRARRPGRPPALPPSRPMDLGTIPGAASQIHAHHAAPGLRLARSRDD